MEKENEKADKLPVLKKERKESTDEEWLKGEYWVHV